MAQCAPGYYYANGVCQPAGAPGYGNPVSGAVSGEAAGAAQGYGSGGPIGAVVGGALGTAGGPVSGTANLFTPPPVRCNYGYICTTAPASQLVSFNLNTGRRRK